MADHSPIWLKSHEVNWGPKPFRVNSCWFENEKFLSFVEEAWKNLKVVGKQAFVLKEKFKLLWGMLRKWNKESFDWINLKVEEASKKIDSIKLIPINDDVINNSERFASRKLASYEFWKHLSVKESLLRQKSRQHWLREGDQNTKFFLVLKMLQVYVGKF